MTRRSSITVKDRRVFLEVLEHGWSVKNAAERTKHARQKFYELRDRDEAFAAAWAAAYEAGTATLEDEARRRGVDGYDESTYKAAGELILRVHRYSDRFCIVCLRPVTRSGSGPLAGLS